MIIAVCCLLLFMTTDWWLFVLVTEMMFLVFISFYLRPTHGFLQNLGFPNCLIFRNVCQLISKNSQNQCELLVYRIYRGLRNRQKRSFCYFVKPLQTNTRYYKRVSISVEHTLRFCLIYHMLCCNVVFVAKFTADSEMIWAGKSIKMVFCVS